MKIRNLLYIFCIASLLAACNESKYLGEGQVLYAANKVKTQVTDVKKKKAKTVASELDDLLRPRLNGKILGLRVKLWIYNIAGTTTREKGFKHWLKYRVGEPPVLASPGLLEKNRDVLQNHLENKGYFRDTVKLDAPVKNKKLTAIYTAVFGPQYTIRNVTFPGDSSDLGPRFDSVKRRSRLRKGEPYDLDVIKDERVRLDTRLKQRGFYFFNPGYLFVDVDTTVGNHQVDMFVKIKEETPDEAKQIWKIAKVKVFAQYDLHSDTNQKRTATIDNIRIVDTAKMFKPSLFANTIIFRPGSVYKLNDHTQTLSRLVSLGVFRFVKAGYKTSDSVTNGLDVTYYLNPTQKKSIRFEVSGLTRSDNTTGAEAAITWRHRNLFKGAELFTSSIYGGLEEQLLGNGVKVSTRRYGVDFNLYFPRILSGPFHWSTSSQFVPKTRINVGYDLFDRSSQYTLNSARASFGYIFKQSLETEHTATLFNINYVRPTNINPEYQKGLDTNLNLARAIERQFIIGSIYNFNYNSLARPNRRRVNNFYLNGNVDVSGNLLGLVTGANLDKGKEVRFFNVPFAQYVRLEGDIRHYLTLGKYTTLASRITGGVGIAYGNSLTLPFVKQFFAGGTNDIRAFRSRALGPGSYFRGNPNKNAFLPDQPGDVKLEMNVEYRTKLFSIVRWALFVDAGNIWTRNYDSSRVGSAFSSRFLNDLGVGIGTGLRFDLSVVVLRIDLATPVRFPWLQDGHKWVFNKVGDISNMVLNLAIGYPF